MKTEFQYEVISRLKKLREEIQVKYFSIYEELLAEDFRKWMLVKKHPFKHLSKAVKEFFINLKDLINIWTSKHLGFGNPSAKRALFKAIRDGKFKESKPAEQVV